MTHPCLNPSITRRTKTQPPRNTAAVLFMTWSLGTSLALFLLLPLHCMYWSHWSNQCSSLWTCAFTSSCLCTHRALTWNSLHFLVPTPYAVNTHSLKTVSFGKLMNPPRLGWVPVLGTSKHAELTLGTPLYCNYLFIGVLLQQTVISLKTGSLS